MIAAAPPPWVRSYVGLPWKPYGRDRGGIDCWGLFRLVQGEQFGRALPLFAERTWTSPPSAAAREAERRALAAVVAGNMQDWRPLWESRAPNDLVPDDLAVEAGDGMLMRRGIHPTHVGLIVAPGWLLHVEEGIDSVCVRYGDMAIRPRAVGVYRWAGAEP